MKTLEKAKSRFKPTFTAEFFSGLAYSRLKDFTNALARYTAAEVIGRATDTNRLTPFLLSVWGGLRGHEAIRQAEKYLKKCLEMSPDFSEAMNYLGYMWAERGVNLSRAKELIDKAVKLEPKNAAYLDSLAWVLCLSSPKMLALDA